MASPAARRGRWKAWAACGLMATIVGVVLMNLISNALVSRYERNAPRDPGSQFLQGATPRELGSPDADRAVLFIHGFIGAQSNFNDLPDRVAEDGWYVRTMRLPGHGSSPRDFERTSAEDLIEGVRDEVRGLKSRFPELVLVGHSLGGALAAVVAAEEPVQGLVLCAPYFELTWSDTLGFRLERFAPSIAPIIRWIPGRTGGGPVNLKENRKHIDYYRWIPTQGMIAAAGVARRARESAILGAITAPVLAIHSRIDTITSPEATAAALPAFASARKAMIWLETSDHVVFWDYESDQVNAAVRAFLEEVKNHDTDQPGVRE